MPGERDPRSHASAASGDSTEELRRRPARAPDHAAESQALLVLAERMASAPKDILQTLTEAAAELCRAQSAGVSLLEEREGRSFVRWQAIAGPITGQISKSSPIGVSPSGLALARRSVVLLVDPARHFPVLSGVTPPVVEALLAPIEVGGKPVGTLWVATHDPERRFDAEDERLLGNLAKLAGAAQATLATSRALRHAQHESEQLAAALRRRDSQFRGLLDTLPVAAYTCDADGLITYFNAQAAALWGREPALLDPGDRWCGSFRMFAADGTPIGHDACWMARTLAEDRAYHAQEIQIERPDGSRVAVLVHASPIHDDAGALLGAVNVLVDVSERRRTQDALHESEQRFARFMERLPGLAWIKDLDGRYVFVNDAAEAAFRKPRAELLGRTDEQVFPAATAARFRENDAQALASGSGVETIEILEQADGLHHSLVSKFPIPRADGRPYLIGGVAIDISERIRAEEALRASEQIHRAIGEAIDYGVWICDAEGRNVYASDSFLKLVGLTQEQCSNFGWSDVLHPDDAERTLAAWRECVRTGGEWYTEHRFRGVDGRWHPVLARGVPIQNERGETTAWAGINLDISRLKQVEEELREADRRKDEFLATLAHELRNPLAPIRNSLALLRMAGTGQGGERVLGMMERQVEQMVRLVDDLLEVSRITRGRIELRRERVTLDAVVRAAVETSRPLLDAAGHRLEVSLPEEELWLDADPVRLGQVFANLLNNAAKYTEPGGRISLAAQREGDELTVTLRDDGVGIRADQLAEIFELFTQVDHTLARAQGGLGIGLTLVKRLVQLHGGRVDAQSDGPGTGSEFRVTLPLAERAAGAPAPPPEPVLLPAEAAPQRILVVDDNADAADSLAMLLRRLGVDVQVSYDGAAALDALASFRPEMVLLDLGMPGMSGFDVAQEIRARSAGHGPLLVALTGWGQPDDRRRTRDAGFDHHLVKPVELQALQSMLSLLEAPRAS